MIPTKRALYLSSWRGSYYRDELGDLISRKFVGNRITDDTVEGTVNYQNNCIIGVDYVIVNTQLNHDRILNSPIIPHLHWLQEADNNPNWTISYRWLVNGKAVPTTWINVKMNTLVFPYISRVLQISEADEIAPPIDSKPSDIIQFRIGRDTDNSTGLFDGVDNIGVIKASSFDIHVQVNKGGTRKEYT